MVTIIIIAIVIVISCIIGFGIKIYHNKKEQERKQFYNDFFASGSPRSSCQDNGGR